MLKTASKLQRKEGLFIKEPRKVDVHIETLIKINMLISSSAY